MIVRYLDDCSVLSKDKRKIKETLINRRSQGCVFKDEGSIEQHLGIKIEDNDGGPITISQLRLIKRIIEALPGLKDANPANTPALSTVMISKNADWKPQKVEWNY